MKQPLPLILLSALAALPAVSPALRAEEAPAPPAQTAAPLDPQTILAELPVGETWSGHPVSFGFLTERGHQFIAYYDADRRMTVVSRKLDSTEWTKFHPEGIHLPGRGRASNITGWDSHNYLALALDRDGYVHLSGNMHNDPLIYYRSSRPFDITSLERLDRMTGEREGNTTYPVFFKNGAGDLMFRYRDGGSGNGADIYNLYDTATRSWRNLLSAPLIDGQGRRNAYAMNPVLGPDGRFHLVWMWRDTPDCATNHTLSYARSTDFQNWEKCDGTPIPLPITLGEADIVDPARIREGLINMTFNLGFDARNRPVVTYHRYDANGRSQAYASRPTTGASRWDIVAISDWDFRWQFSGGGSIAAEVTLGGAVLQPDKSLLVDFTTTHSAGAGRLRLDPETLQRIETLPPPAGVLPPTLATARAEFPGMEVQTAVSRDAGRRWVLRWETLPRNRDRPRDVAPPATELRLYELPDTDTGGAFRVGS